MSMAQQARLLHQQSLRLQQQTPSSSGPQSPYTGQLDSPLLYGGGTGFSQVGSQSAYAARDYTSDLGSDGQGPSRESLLDGRWTPSWQQGNLVIRVSRVLTSSFSIF